MSKNVKIVGMKDLNKKLRRLAKNSEADDVIVGFTQSYAIHVHENLTAKHPVGQAKFLEEPARTLSGELFRMITAVYKKTNNFQNAIILAGLRLQRAAQKLTPIDTSALKNSAFTAKAVNASAKAQEALTRSNQIRVKK